MNVKQLIEELKKYPETMDVFMAERRTEYAYGLLNSVSVKEVLFEPNDDFESEDVAKENCVILSED
jgi:hypothetical protein